MPFTVVRNDITKMRVDAIVNAANTGLRMGGGVCGAIFEAAGADRLEAACERLAPIRTGDVAITPGYDLPAKFVIHAVGPIYDPDDKKHCEEQLRSAYANSLVCAVGNGCGSVAFPLISSGIYGYPKEEAIRVAANAIFSFLKDQELTVYLVIFDEETFLLCKNLLGETTVN